MTVDAEFRTPLGVTIAGGRATVRIAGDVDLLAVNDLLAAVEVLLEQQVQRIDVHLGDVGRVDSHALEALAATHERLVARGGRLAVLEPSDRVADDFRRRGLSGLLRVGSRNDEPAAAAAP